MGAYLNRLPLVVMYVLLSACSGGNTSSGGPDPSSFAGQFSGNFSITATATVRPAATTTTTGSAQATVTEFNRIDLTLSNGIQVLGSLDTVGQFEIVSNAANVVTDATCAQGTITIAGGFSGPDSIAATITSNNLICDGLQATFEGQISLTRS